MRHNAIGLTTFIGQLDHSVAKQEFSEHMTLLGCDPQVAGDIAMALGLHQIDAIGDAIRNAQAAVAVLAQGWGDVERGVVA